jgi:hypothetical protein
VFPLVGRRASLAIHYYLRLRTAPLPIRRDEMTAENIAREGLGLRLPDKNFLANPDIVDRIVRMSIAEPFNRQHKQTIRSRISNL